MEILKERKIKKGILLLGIMASAIILLNTKVYAINVPTDKIYAKSLDTGYWAVGKSSEWTCSSSNNKVVKVWKRENKVYYQALNPGEATINIHNNVPFYTSGRKIIVSKPKTNLSITGVKKTNNNEEDIFIDFSKTWNVKTRYGWSVNSPNIGIIKVTKQDKVNGKLTYKALKAGKTYIDIKCIRLRKKNYY